MIYLSMKVFIAFFNATGAVTDDGNSIIISSLNRINSKFRTNQNQKTKIQESGIWNDPKIGSDLSK